MLGRSDTPNATLGADFKGEFRLGEGTLCCPLTISDLFSRYLRNGLSAGQTSPSRPSAAAAAITISGLTLVRTSSSVASAVSE